MNNGCRQSRNPAITAAAHAAVLAGVFAGLSGGCASTADCAPGMARARDAGEQALPLGQFIDSMPRECRTDAERTWARILREDCQPLYAFHAGRTDRPVPGACGGEEFESAWNLGRMLANLEREHSEIEMELAGSRITPEQRTHMRQRRVVIERDLPVVRALARMEGYLPPADVPENRGFELPRK